MLSKDVIAGAPTKTPSMIDTLAHDLDTLSRAGLRRSLRTVEHRRGAEIVVDGKPTVDFSSNDYLGLAGDPRLAQAAIDFLKQYHVGAAAARLISGNYAIHTELERELAKFKNTEAALLFSSGYTANTGTIPALVSKRDVVYSDALNHASLLDAVRMSRAEVRVFPHADLAALRKMLTEDTGKFRRRLIVVDGVFSMDGDLFPLDKLVPLAREFDAWTYVDDAHGTAVIGANGRGSVEHFGVEGEIDVIMGTLGKALGGAGAFIAGSSTLIEYLLHRARTFVFTTGSPPVLSAVTLKALEIVQNEPWRREQLWKNARYLREGLIAMGREAPGEPDAYIVPVIIGSVEETVRVGTQLREAGYLVGAVRPPTVPLGTSRLRITVSSAHTQSQIDGLLETLKTVLR
jgi:8-amino-7-oxononanoate synthase